MADIMAAGYSRILVYEGEDTRNIRGYLQVRRTAVDSVAASAAAAASDDVLNLSRVP